MPRTGWKQLKRLRGHERAIGEFAFSPDGTLLATPGADGRLVVWDVRSGRPAVVREIRRVLYGVAWSPRGDAIAAIVSDHRDGTPAADYIQGDPEIRSEDDALADFEEADDEAFPFEDAPSFIRLFDSESALQLGSLATPSVAERPAAVAWIDDSKLVAASADGVAWWHARDGHFLGFLQDDDESGAYSGVALSGDGRHILAAESAGVVKVWNPESGARLLTIVPAVGRLTCLSSAPGSSRFSFGDVSGGVEVWDGIDEKADLRTLEGHTRAVTSISFSADGRLLASAARDGTVRVWDARSWTLLGEQHDSSMVDMDIYVKFAPSSDVLAATADRGRAVKLWQLDVPTLAARQRRPKTVNYVNAKVVLLGDSGVGKTGLGLVLCRQAFRPTESTHKRNVWLLSETSTTGSAPERREVFLWDLAGQPGYRLLHQLHLADVAVALVVFDSRSEVDPLAGVRYWSRALTQAERQRQLAPGRIHRLLVAARMDRGGAKVDDEELRDARSRFGFDDYITTSAKEEAGVDTLRRAIEEAIDWDAVPKVSSTVVFDAIRAFLLHKRDTKLVLAREAELRAQFSATGAVGTSNVDDEFRTCVERAQARGLVRRLSFGDLVLLNPEFLDAYAAAVLHAAAADADSLGAIREADVREGRFPIPTDDRLSDQDTERLLLLATIEDLLYHEVALREDSGDGTYLVFPSQVRRHVKVSRSLAPYARLAFEGPVAHVWATLIVRLAHSGVFSKDEVGDSVALFRALGRLFAIRLTLLDEGSAELELLREAHLELSEAEELLEEFVHAHLRRRAVTASIVRRRVTVCSCGFVVPDDLLLALQGLKEMNCPVCPEHIILQDASSRPDDAVDRDQIRQLQQTADGERARLASRATVAGKEAVHDFDVFLAHNSVDKKLVEALAERLRDAGLNPWLDKDEIAPGQWFQDVIQDAVTRVRSAAVIVGPHGMGRWEAMELRVFVSACIERGIPVIPVLLPGADLPVDARFLRELQYVEFLRSVEDEEPFARLVWGITGDKSRLDLLASKS